MNHITKQPQRHESWWVKILQDGLKSDPWKRSETLRASLTPEDPSNNKQIHDPEFCRQHPERQIPASAIRKALLSDDISPDPKGLILNGVCITGELNLNGAEIPCQLTITNSYFHEKPTFKGAVVPYLDLKGSTFPGISLERATIKGALRLDGVTSHGTISGIAMKVGDRLQLNGARVLTDQQDLALNLEKAKVDCSIRFDNLETTGAIRARNIECGGDVKFDGAIIKGAATKGYSVHLQRAQIRGTAYFRQIETTGYLDATGATFQAGVTLNTRDLRGEPPVADFSHTKIGRLKIFYPHVTFSRTGGWKPTPQEEGSKSVEQKVQGVLDLSHSTIQTLDVDELRNAQELPHLHSALGWSIGSIHGFLGSDKRAMRDWLDTVPFSVEREGVSSPRIIIDKTGEDSGQPIFDEDAITERPSFSAQPWTHVASAFGASGQEAAANWLHYNTASRVTKTYPTIRRWLRRIFYGSTVGYGYRPWFIAFWFIALYLVNLGVANATASQFVPTDHNVTAVIEQPTRGASFWGDLCLPGISAGSVEGNFPPFNTCLYALDSAIPLASTNQSEHWVSTNGGVAIYFSLMKGLTWVFTALTAAAVGKLLRLK